MANATHNRPTKQHPTKQHPTKQHATKQHKVTTPPKGRPTPPRSGRRHGGRVFGSTFQWVAAAGALAVALVIVYLAAFA